MKLSQVLSAPTSDKLTISADHSLTINLSKEGHAPHPLTALRPNGLLRATLATRTYQW